MNSVDFKLKINLMKQNLGTLEISTQVYNELVEYSFFRIFTYFSQSIENYFYHYTLGDKSFSGRCPKRKLMFTSVEQINQVIKKQGDFFNLDLLERVSIHIFEEPTPFEIIKANYSSEFSDMKILRDYIAHKSDIAKSKYIEHFCKAGDLEPFQVLLTKTKKQKMNRLDNYFGIMVQVLEYIHNSGDS
jgi:hypothetical protein